MAAKQVRGGAPVADIGCDHGKLAVFLALEGAPAVTAVDSRPLPLEKAKALVRQCGCAAVVRCVLGNGLLPLAPADADDIVVAGLGGEVMAEIIGGVGWTKDARLRFVLVPTTRHAHLRRWLCENGFALLAEHPVLEHGRPYTVMTAGFTGEAVAPTPLFCQVGRVAQTVATARAAGDESLVPAANAYIRARLAALEKAGRAPLKQAARAAHQQLVKDVEGCLL